MLLLATAASSWIRPPGQRVPARQSLATSFQSALAAVCAKAPWDPPYDVVPGRVEDEGSEEVLRLPPTCRPPASSLPQPAAPAAYR